MINLKDAFAPSVIVLLLVATGCTQSSTVEETSLTEHFRFNHRTWYQDTIAGPALVSSSGRYVLYYKEVGWLLFDGESKEIITAEAATGYDSVPLVNWLPGDRLEFKGRKDGKLNREVINLASGEMEESPLPRNSWYMRVSDDEQVLLGWQLRDKKTRAFR